MCLQTSHLCLGPTRRILPSSTAIVEAVQAASETKGGRPFYPDRVALHLLTGYTHHSLILSSTRAAAG